MKLRSFFLILLSLWATASMVLAQVGAPIPVETPSNRYWVADPVDLGTGLYFRVYQDLKVEDTIPIVFTRTQRSMDRRVRSFGVGAMTSYDMWIIGDATTWTWVSLVMPDGSQERFPRVSPGSKMADAVFVDIASSTEFQGAEIRWVGNHWSVKLTNGTEYIVQACNQQSKPGQCAVSQIRNAAGDVLKIDRDSEGNIVRITSPHGHTVRVMTDADGKIIHAADDSGHWLVYSYDSLGELIKAMNSQGVVEKFGYDSGMNLSDIHEIEPARGKLPAYDFTAHNDYDLFGRTIKQVLSTGQVYEFSYVTGDRGENRQATVKDNSGTTTTTFERRRVVRTEFVGRPASWILDIQRDGETGAINGGMLQCGNGRHVSVPVNIVKAANKLGGDAEREAYGVVCTGKSR